jgi:anti-anti-sigma factor
MVSEDNFLTPATAARPAQAVVEAFESVTVVYVSGEIDMTTRDAVERIVNREIDTGTGAVVIDLTDVTFFGSSGLQLLANARARAQGAGRPLRLVANSRTVLRPLAITSLDDIFPVHATTSEAVSAAQQA